MAEMTDGSALKSIPVQHMMDEDDAKSIATDVAENLSSIAAEIVKEYVVKFSFRPKDDDNSEVAKTHFILLKTILQLYGDSTKIFDNFGSHMAAFETPKNYEKYLRHFKLEYVRGNASKKRKPMYIVYHRFQSASTLNEIKKHASVYSLLQKHNARMSLHRWNEDETRISNLGFFVQSDPSNYLHEDFEERIRNRIQARTGRSKKKIPRFQVSYTSPFAFTPSDVRVSTKAFGLEVRQKDAKDMVKLLLQTFTDDGGFIFHKLRHENLQAYITAIRRQNSYLSNSRVVPIQGIPKDMMFALENDLLQVDGIREVLLHKETVNKGRYNLLTTQQHFTQVTEFIRAHLTDWVSRYSQETPLDPDHPPVGLAFRHQRDADSSNGSFVSYLSSLSSIYGFDAPDPIDQPPASTVPVPQAWGNIKIPKAVIEADSATTKSEITTEEYEKRNHDLLKQIADLTKQVKNLQAAQQPPVDVAALIQQISTQIVDTMWTRMHQQSPLQPMFQPPEQPLHHPAHHMQHQPHYPPSPMPPFLTSIRTAKETGLHAFHNIRQLLAPATTS